MSFLFSSQVISLDCHDHKGANMEPDNITICEALMASGHNSTRDIARIMAITFDHARSLQAQVMENELANRPDPNEQLVLAIRG